MTKLSFRVFAMGVVATGLMVPLGAFAQRSIVIVPVPQPTNPGSVTGTDPVPPPPPPSVHLHRALQ